MISAKKERSLPVVRTIGSPQCIHVLLVMRLDQYGSIQIQLRIAARSLKLAGRFQYGACAWTIHQQRFRVVICDAPWLLPTQHTFTQTYKCYDERVRAFFVRMELNIRQQSRKRRCYLVSFRSASTRSKMPAPRGHLRHHCINTRHSTSRQHSDSFWAS